MLNLWQRYYPQLSTMYDSMLLQ